MISAAVDSDFIRLVQPLSYLCSVYDPGRRLVHIFRFNYREYYPELRSCSGL